MAERANNKSLRPFMGWSIGRKLYVASGLMILLVLLIGGIGLWQIYNIGRTVNDVLIVEQQRAQSLALSSAGHELVGALDRMVLEQDPTLASTRIAVSMGQLDFYLKSLQGSAERTGTSYLLEGLEATQSELQKAVREIDVLARQEQWAEASAMLEQRARPAYDQVGYLTRRLAQRAEQDVETEASRARAVIRRMTIVMPLLLAFTIVLAVGVRQIVLRDVGHSIDELREGVARITGGDLEHTLNIRTGDEIEELGDEFNKMASRLADLIGSLEERVAERTRDLERRAVQLEAAAEVARGAAAIRDVGDLLDETVHLISDRFGFYHTGIFLLDKPKEYAVLQAASSEGGRRMLVRGHKLRVGEVGIVGYTADTREPRIALDVGEDAVYFDNPDLPLTRSEMALPLEVRGEVIGVLDVQSRKEAAFTHEDVEVLRTMADQIALAIENARLMEESQQALEELEMLYGERAREAWRERTTRRRAAYRYTGVGVEPTAPTMTEEETSSPDRRPVIQEGDDDRRLASPIRVRGQEIGSIVLRQDPAEEPWSEEEIELMEEVSDQIALALENARLLEEAQRRVLRERLTSEVTTRMRSSLDLESVLRTAADEMYQTLDLEEVVVRLTTGSTSGGASSKGTASSDGDGRISRGETR